MQNKLNLSYIFPKMWWSSYYSKGTVHPKKKNLSQFTHKSDWTVPLNNLNKSTQTYQFQIVLGWYTEVLVKVWIYAGWLCCVPNAALIVQIQSIAPQHETCSFVMIKLQEMSHSRMWAKTWPKFWGLLSCTVGPSGARAPSMPPSITPIPAKALIKASPYPAHHHRVPQHKQESRLMWKHWIIFHFSHWRMAVQL